MCTVPFELILLEAPFFKEVLDLFISAERVTTLLQDLSYRPQEVEAVNVTVEGLSAEVRNCLVFADHSRNVEDLDSLRAYQ